MPLNRLSVYLQKVIPHTIHERRNGQIVKSLSTMNHLQTNAKLLEARSQRFYISRDRRCAVCGKPISDHIIAAHPVDSKFVKLQHDSKTDQAPTLGRAGSTDSPRVTSTTASLSQIDSIPLSPEDEKDYVVVHYRCLDKYKRDAKHKPVKPRRPNRKTQQLQNYG